MNNPDCHQIEIGSGNKNSNMFTSVILHQQELIVISQIDYISISKFDIVLDTEMIDVNN